MGAEVFSEPFNAPFAVGDKVRYTGPAFNVTNRDGTFQAKPNDIGECIMITTGRRGGVYLGLDYNGWPEYSSTVHDRSTIRFANGYEAIVDAQMSQFELAEAAPEDQT